MHSNNYRGFTVVEMVVAIAVLAIIATIVAVSYSSVRNDSMTTQGESLANQVALKSRAYYSAISSWPTISQLKSSFVPGEAKLSNPDAVVAWISGTTAGRVDNVDTYANGERVVYRACSSGGIVFYWDYHKSVAAGVTFGRGC